MSEQADKQEQIAELEAKIAAMAQEEQDLKKQVSELIAKEAAGQGVFAQKVFRLGQKRQMLHTEMQHLRVRINYLLLDI